MSTIPDIYLRVNHNLKIIIDRDPNLQRKDSIHGVFSLIEDIKTIITMLNQLSVEERATHFNVTYNAVVYISDMAALLRKSSYSFETIKALIDCILAMENNIVLQDAKYLDKRTNLYLDICHIYEENEYPEAAATLLETAVNNYKELRTIHLMDPPVPEHIEAIITTNTQILKAMLIKYMVQGGALSPTDWRKRADE
jgi:hypothetical protein